jgi:cell division septation protein DedD
MADEKKAKKRQWRLQIDLGPLSIILWGILIFFCLIWIFVLGIFVGRGFFPGRITSLTELKSEINRLEETVSKEKTTKAETASPIDIEKEPELAFYDRLTTKKDDAIVNSAGQEKEDKKEDTVTTKPVTDTPAVTKDKETASAAPATGDKDADAVSPDAKDKSAWTAPSGPKSGKGKYTIQVAAIPEYEKAEKTVKLLIEKGFDAYYYETTIKGKTYYRVRCGSYPTKEDAAKHTGEIEKKAGLKGCYVTDVD